MKAAHLDEHIGVFFCGPGGLSSGIRETCRSLNRRKATGGRQGTEDGETPSLSGSARPSKRRGGEISYFEEVFFSSDVGAKVVNKK